VWESVPFVWLLRAMVTPLVGDSIARALPPQLILILGIVIAVLAIALMLRTPRRVAGLVLLLVFVVPLAGIAVGGEATGDLFRPWIAPRYFWPAGVGLMILIAMNWRSLVALPLLALFVVGATLEWRIPPQPSVGWAQRSVCIGRDAPCEIPVLPGDKWNVHWQP